MFVVISFTMQKGSYFDTSPMSFQILTECQD